MFRVVALASGFGWHVEDLRRAAKELGVTFNAVGFPTIAGGFDGRGGGTLTAGEFDLLDADAILVRMMPPGSLEQVVYRMDALHRLEARGSRVMNPPRAVETSVDKYLTLARLDQAGLSVPETWVGESVEDALVAFDRLGGDVVVKPLFGSEGRGLVRLGDREVAWRTFHALARVGSVLYLQRFIPHDGHDFRVFVLGGRVLGAIARRARPGDWRTNVALGGLAEPITADSELERLSLQATNAVGARMAGIDLIHDPIRDQLTILEVNAVPGWRALASATRIDVASALLQDLRDDRR